MKTRLSLWVLLLLIFMPLTAVFADITIKAEIDKKTITTDEVLAYKLIVSATTNIAPRPQFPKFEGFKILSRAQSSTISFVKGGAKTIFVYAFILYPERKGKLKISPAHIKVGDTDIISESYEVEVKQGKRKIEPHPDKKPSLPQKINSNTEQFTL